MSKTDKVIAVFLLFSLGFMIGRFVEAIAIGNIF